MILEAIHEEKQRLNCWEKGPKVQIEQTKLDNLQQLCLKMYSHIIAELV